MKPVLRLMRGFFSAGMMAGVLLGVASCGDYALFKVDIRVTDTAAAPRYFIETCRMTIRNNGAIALNRYVMDRNACGDGRTKFIAGTFSYSTSDVKGRFKFELQAFNSDDKVIQSGEAEGTAAPFPPEIVLTITTAAVQP